MERDLQDGFGRWVVKKRFKSIKLDSKVEKIGSSSVSKCLLWVVFDFDL